MNYKISVIMPVYNSEKFISRALRSLSAQTFKDFEVIIIDDGSKDFSLKIIKHFCSINTNFRYIKIPHFGVSRARNIAIKIAKGTYIAFVDSDDRVAPNFLENLYKGIKIKNSDVCVCNYWMYFPNLRFNLINFFHARTGIYNIKKIIKILFQDIFMKSFLCNKLFKKKLFENIEIPNMCFEDKIVMVQIFHAARRVSVINSALYFYTKHKNSLSNITDEQKLKEYILAFEFLIYFLKSKNKYNKISSFIPRLNIFFNAEKLFTIKYIIKEKNFKLFYQKTTEILERIRNFKTLKMLKDNFL
ncbi:MAG: glycosyltransferase [Oscillospiraceae bacterium]|jgi:glycosyltransferase involved in cell wall biosynthesis|nr:glycosyltransferase [Oscillospiraceae bacterium]